MSGKRTKIIAFGRFKVDTARGESCRDGEAVACEPQVFDLVPHLAADAGEIVTRDELTEHVWGGRIVSASAIAGRINAARAALGDDGTAQRYVKTVPRGGFRFEAEPTNQSVAAAASHLPDEPSIAVLPFQNMSGDPEQPTSRMESPATSSPTFRARPSSSSSRATPASPGADSAMPLAGIARKLGVQYIAEGAVRRAGNRIRVTARLVDPWRGNELWAERYDLELTDIFAVQDDVTGVIVNTLAGQIARQHCTRIQAKSLGAFDAYHHALKAAEHAFRTSPKDNLLAREEARQAVDLDAGFARPHAIVALTPPRPSAPRIWPPAPQSPPMPAIPGATRCSASPSSGPIVPMTVRSPRCAGPSSSTRATRSCAGFTPMSSPMPGNPGPRSRKLTPPCAPIRTIQRYFWASADGRRCCWGASTGRCPTSSAWLR